MFDYSAHFPMKSLSDENDFGKDLPFLLAFVK